MEKKTNEAENRSLIEAIENLFIALDRKEIFYRKVSEAFAGANPEVAMEYFAHAQALAEAVRLLSDLLKAYGVLVSEEEMF